MIRFLDWQLYNLQVDQVFLLIGLIVLSLLFVGWLVFRASMRAFEFLLKTGLGLGTLILVILWITSLLS